MIETLAKDISRWQGSYSETSEPIVFIKISGGDQGLYYDSQATNNYNQAIAHGHAFGGYHFAGGGDPIAEANFFIAGMKPLLPGEVAALDWEISHPDPVGWCLAFVTQVHESGAWPLIYMNLATLLAHDWSPVLKNCGLWLADWNNNPEGDIDTHGQTYVMQQYNDGPNYDHDMFFGSVDQFKKYGWPAPLVAPPAPAPTPPTPAPTPPPIPTVLPQLTNQVPTPVKTVTQAAPTPKPVPNPVPKPSWRDWLSRLFHKLFK